MVFRIFQSSIAWRLNSIILSIVLMMAVLGGAVYYFKTQDDKEYDRLLSNLDTVNDSSRMVQDIVGSIMVYRATPTDTLAATISSSIHEVQKNIESVQAQTNPAHEQSIYVVQGLKEILANLEQIYDRVAHTVNGGRVTVELFEDLELLNILIEIVQRNTSRYVINELAYADEFQESIDKRNRVLGLLLFLFSTLTIGLVSLFVVIIQKSVVRPILHVEGALNRYRHEGEYDNLPVKSIDEIGSLTGAINEVVATVQQREAALAKSEGKYRELYDMAPVVLSNADMDDRLIEVNDAWLKSLGYQREEVLGTRATGYLTDSSKEKVQALLPTLYSEGVVRDVDVQYVSKAGETRDFLLTADLELDDNGEPRGIRAASIDVSDSIRMRDEKEKLELQLHQSQKLESIGRLAGGVAHDLNNLLTPIIGYSELLLDDPSITGTQRDDVNQICVAGESAKEVVGQLLAFSRKQALNMKPVDINETLQGYEKLLRRTIREDITIKMVLTSGIREVRGDVGQLQQVIMNLSVNAADAMPDGGLFTIETQEVSVDAQFAATHSEMADGEYVLMTFSDSGSGMDETTREQIFEPFFSTKGDMGTGLGLSTVYGIVKQHHGDITVYSEPGAGTVFKVYLPVLDKGGEKNEIEPTETGDLTGSETILLAEDNKQVRHITAGILGKMGYTVLSAEDGEQALNISEKTDTPIHLLLTDVIMPGMNGKELAERVLGQRPEVKVMYMSGYTDEVIVDHGVLEDDVVFIQKPFSQQLVAAKIRELLDS